MKLRFLLQIHSNTRQEIITIPTSSCSSVNPSGINHDVLTYIFKSLSITAAYQSPHQHLLHADLQTLQDMTTYPTLISGDFNGKHTAWNIQNDPDTLLLTQLDYNIKSNRQIITFLVQSYSKILPPLPLPHTTYIF